MKEIKGLSDGDGDPVRRRRAGRPRRARRLAAHLLEHGSHGLVIAGSTGECPTLTDGEEIELLQAVRAEVGDEVLLVCGTGTNDTRHSCELTKMAADAGADASLVVVPYYNKPNPAGIRAHFETVAAAVPELPMVMYNIPSRVIINADPELLGELGRRVDNIVAVKQANDDELGPIEGLTVLAGNDNALPPRARVRRRRRHPRRLPHRRRPDAGDVGRRPGRRPRARPRRSTPRSRRSTRRPRSPPTRSR